MRNHLKVLSAYGLALVTALMLAVPATAQIHELEKRLAASKPGMPAAAQRMATTQCTTFCSECFYLDTYDPNNTLPGDLIAHSTVVLQQGAMYLVTIQGTYSVWPLSQWTGNGGGATEVAPQYPTLGITNGPVVADWEWLFGWYEPTALNLPLPLPFQGISTDGGVTYTQPIPLAGSAYVSNHIYQYVIVGQNARAFFKKHDTPTNDNYGRFKICIQMLTPCGSITLK